MASAPSRSDFYGRCRNSSRVIRTVTRAVYIELSASDYDRLKLLQTEVLTELIRSKLNVDRLMLRQQQGFQSVMPSGKNMFRDQFERVLPARSVANLYRFNYSGKTDPHGFYVGRDKFGSNVLVDFNQRAEGKTNGSILILGNSGQGKSYLLSQGDNVLPAPPNAREKLRGSGFTPYIFTHDEVRRIFDASDNWKNQGASFTQCAPLLFRLLYGTGLRVNEALSLTAGDISLRQQILLIREAKNDNSRLVPMSQSLSERVADYLSAHGYPEGEPVFQHDGGKQFHTNTAYDWFRQTLWKAGIPHSIRISTGFTKPKREEIFAKVVATSVKDSGSIPNMPETVGRSFILWIKDIGHRRHVDHLWVRIFSEEFPHNTERYD